MVDLFPMTSQRNVQHLFLPPTAHSDSNYITPHWAHQLSVRVTVIPGIMYSTVAVGSLPTVHHWGRDSSEIEGYWVWIDPLNAFQHVI